MKVSRTSQENNFQKQLQIDMLKKYPKEDVYLQKKDKIIDDLILI